MIKTFYFISVLLFVSIGVFGQDIPERPSPQRLVNDIADILTPDEENILEQKLIAFDDSTSTQVCLVIVPTLNGYEKYDFATQIGEKWGVGQKDKNNGVVFLVKPKTDSERGELFIAVGYGLEGVLPDGKIKQIEESEIIPFFKENNYFGGIDAGVNSIISLSKGEYNAEPKSENDWLTYIIVGFIALVVIVSLFSKNKGGGGRSSWGSGVGGATMWHSGGSFSNFSSGGGSFGGFGGGSFGGGGAGGSW